MMDRIIASERIASVIKPDWINLSLILLKKVFLKRKIILKRRFTSGTFAIRKIAINLLQFMVRVVQANRI